MHGSRRYRDQEARAPWTNRKLIISKCTLYLFVVFGLELKSSATGEEKVHLHFLDGRKCEHTFNILRLGRL